MKHIFLFIILTTLKSQDVDPSLLNPFSQPSETTIYYGSGDVDSSGIVDWNDYNAMLNNVQNDMADVDGDGVASTAQDQQELSDYLSGTSSYLPGHWNYLQTREERESWLTKMLAIDQTDTNEWVHPTWISGDFARQTYINTRGLLDTTDQNIPDKYNLSTNGRFNIPMYFLGIYHPQTGWGHGMNSVVVGDNPLNPDDLSFTEPQNDSINIQPGGWNIPYETLIFVDAIKGFNSSGGSILEAMATFSVDSVGNIEYVSSHENLILERPSVGIGDEEPEIASQYKLSQNYPNPFNPLTTFRYELPENSFVNISIYDMLGRHVKTLVNQTQNAGFKSVVWDATNGHGKPVSAGVYLYQIHAGEFVQTKKMILVK